MTQVNDLANLQPIDVEIAQAEQLVRLDEKLNVPVFAALKEMVVQAAIVTRSVQADIVRAALYAYLPTVYPDFKNQYLAKLKREGNHD